MNQSRCTTRAYPLNVGDAVERSVGFAPRVFAVSNSLIPHTVFDEPRSGLDVVRVHWDEMSSSVVHQSGSLNPTKLDRHRIALLVTDHRIQQPEEVAKVSRFAGTRIANYYMLRCPFGLRKTTQTRTVGS